MSEVKRFVIFNDGAFDDTATVSDGKLPRFVLASDYDQAAKDAVAMAELVIETWESNQPMMTQEEYHAACQVQARYEVGK